MFMSLNLKKDVFFGSNKRTQLRFKFVYSNFFFNLKNLSQNISDVLYAEYKNRVIKEMYFIEGIQSMISYEVIHVLDHIRNTGNTWFRKRNIGKYDVKFN